MQLQKRAPQLKAAGIKVIGISVDSPAQNRALAARLKLTYVTLLSDTHVKGAASKAFGYWDRAANISKLAAMVVKRGNVVFRANGKPSPQTLIKAAR